LPNLIVKSKDKPDEGGSIVKVTPESAGWEYVGFEVIRLGGGENVERETGGEEVCLVSLRGSCSVSSDSGKWEIGGRQSPFDGPPHALYLPPGTAYRVEADSGLADSGLELAICSAPAEKGGVKAFEVRPEDIEVEVRGSGNMERKIHPILMAGREAERLLVVEVLTPNGHWSSYPPHKHDRNAPPEETYLEETYYHRVKQKGGFAVQRVYTDDRSLDETMTVSDGDVVLVPKGYHPVSAPPGYDLYYLNVMAGPIRQWTFKNDPDHEWLF
jgi:5-deoxy-glucuronate isomerase